MSEEARLRICLELFAKYSGFGLTCKTDRAIAIRSLETAIAEALDAPINYGILDFGPGFIHYSLLWRKAAGPLERIKYRSGPEIPSWSWMAYTGQIEYPKISQFNWWSSSLSFRDDRRLEARVLKFQGCKIHYNESGSTLRNEVGLDVGQLWFDTEETKSKEIRCAVLGKHSRFTVDYHILLVEEIASAGDQLYKRVGAGFVEPSCIAFTGYDRSAWRGSSIV